ncbi:hypothetical protein OH768_11550 [Streptomyces sp. NBC_01622]|uniref:hypothetical protein n=1 Tax=Streptomyces sp. NBC_01622 TaxID=2975903 RepID=UPI0038702E18|nr:hypothetical protein OH768_11550 [Streptomyces sp. NBC_01622]
MTTTPADPQGQDATLELLNSELASRLTRQSDSLAKIDTKAIFLIGFAATAAQFLATHKHQPVLTYVAFAAYALALAAGMQTFRVADHRDLEARPLLDAHAGLLKGQALAALAAARVVIFERNQERERQKAKLWGISLWSLVVGLVLSTAALVMHD